MKLKKFKNVVPVVGLSAYLTLGVIGAYAMSPSIKKEAMKEYRTEMKETKKTYKPALVNAEISGINGSSFTAIKGGASYTINTDSATAFVRKYGGKSSISEFSVGDMVNVRGSYTDDAKTTISAKYVRDISIFKRMAQFKGSVTAKDATTLTVNTQNKGSQVAVVTDKTKYMLKGKAITSADVVVGDTVEIFGVWNSKQNRMIETTRVKKF